MIDSDNMFYGCTSLVGSQGTAYDENFVDATRAHIDGGPSNPGYLTGSNDSLRGDVNGDGAVNIADLNVIINAILTGNMNMDCDLNGDNSINIADVNAVIGIILGGGAPAPNNHGYVDLGLPIRAVRISR